MKYVDRDEAVSEIRFQQNEMKRFMEGWIEEFAEHPRKYKRAEVMEMLKDMSLEYCNSRYRGAYGVDRSRLKYSFYRIEEE